MLRRLTAVRAAAALAVFVFHLGRWGVVAVPLFAIGYVGVAFFFVLSGFVLMWGTRPGLPARTFYRRRFARVWPSHFVMLLAALVLPVVAIDRGLRAAVPNLFLVQAWSHDGAVIYGMNGVSWSLACEAFFYATFPLSVLVVRRLPAPGRLTLAAVALLGEFLIAHLHPSYGFSFPIARLPEFLIGMVAASLLIDGWRPRLPPVGALLLIAVVWVLSRHLAQPMPDVTLVLPFAALIVSLAVRDLARPADGLLTHPWLVFAGEASFAFYLVHELAIINLKDHLGSSAVQVPVILAVSLSGAVALHLLVERPANKRLRDRSQSVALQPVGST